MIGGMPISPCELQFEGNNNNNNNKEKIKKAVDSNEPISVLDTRRSPSPSTSNSTHSSFNNLPAELKNLPGGGQTDDWSAELQPFPSGVEQNPLRFSGGLEDWESLLSESGQDQSLLRWISGDFPDDQSFSLKQLLQAGDSLQNEQNAPLENVHDDGRIVLLGSVANPDLNPKLLPFEQKPQAISPQVAVNVPKDERDPSIGVFSPSTDQFQNLQPPLKRHNSGLNSRTAVFVPGDEVSFRKLQLQHLPLLSLPINAELNQQHFSQGLDSNLEQNHQYLSQFGLGSNLGQKQQHVSHLGMSNSLEQKLQHLVHVGSINDAEHKQHHFSPMGLNAIRFNPQQKPLLSVKQEAMVAANQQQQIICDQLCSAAELILAGNFSHAQGILARLNHQLSCSPMADPFQRAAFYFKEALQAPLSQKVHVPSPVDGLFKMGAYKMLSEVSPLVHFMNFTSNQVILEALEDAKHIHVIDFDIGFGAQWASFMQELPGGNGGSSPISLKITAFASPSTHHPIELGLMHENLTLLARELGITFVLEIVNLDSFDPSSFLISGNEVIAVNCPIWSFATRLPTIASLLLFIKQLSPRIVVSLDHGCERTDLPFCQHLLEGIRYYEILLESIGATNLDTAMANKIEKFVFQPRIENMILGRLHAPDFMHPWKALFPSIGYLPMPLSNFAETQGECVARRSHVRGFNVERKQGSLVLCWQHHELMTVSAWK